MHKGYSKFCAQNSYMLFKLRRLTQNEIKLLKWDRVSELFVNHMYVILKKLTQNDMKLL